MSKLLLRPTINMSAWELLVVSKSYSSDIYTVFDLVRSRKISSPTENIFLVMFLVVSEIRFFLAICDPALNDFSIKSSLATRGYLKCQVLFQNCSISIISHYFYYPQKQYFSAPPNLKANHT